LRRAGCRPCVAAPRSAIARRHPRPERGELGRGTTDADGRISDFGVASLSAGVYRLVFETGPYLSQLGSGRAGAAEPDASEPPFFPEVVVTFAADGLRPRYHVPLLLSLYSYSTYRGS